MYKLTHPDGLDFYSGTINYRKAIGTIVRITDYDPPKVGSCGKGLHASRNPNDCFSGAKIPCAAFKVKGIQPIAGDSRKTRYQALKIIEEINDLDTLFGWKYSEAINPINPFLIIPPQISSEHIELLKVWASVWDSTWDSKWDSKWAFVRDSVRDSVRDFVGAFVRDSVGDSVWDSVGDSMWASVRAYAGSLFLIPEYPYQSVVDLWQQGLVTSFDGKKWRLYGGKKAEILWEGKIRNEDDLRSSL